MKVTDHVYKIDCTHGSYAYAIRTDEGVTLIDTSLPGRSDHILAELNSYGIKPEEIRKILLTHHDIDHIGNSTALSEKCGCTVYISEIDLPYVLGQKKRDGIKKMFGYLMKVRIPKTIDSFDGEALGGFQILPTPGHTRGHSCFKYDNVLFVGDLVSEKDGHISPVPKIMTWDMTLLLKSVRNLDVSGIEWLCPAHGKPFKIDQWQNFLKSLD